MKEFKETMENEVIEEVEVVEEEVREEGLGSKIKAGLKKHGKKLLIAAGVIGVGLVGYKLGKQAVDGILIDDEAIDDVIEIAEDSVTVENL